MQGREFMTLIGSAVASPLAARAQQRDRLARIAVWVGGAETDPQGQRRATALREALRDLGWVEGRNIAIEYHWAIIDGEQVRAETAELVVRNPGHEVQRREGGRPRCLLPLLVDLRDRQDRALRRLE